MLGRKSQNPGDKAKRYLLTLFAFLLAGVLLWAVLRDLDVRTFWNVVISGKYFFLLVTLPISSINYYLRAVRWNILIGADSKIAASTVFWINMIGYLGNMYLPARSGEAIRSVLLGRQSGSGTSFTLATALTERVTDGFALILLGSAIMLTQPNVPEFISDALRLVTFGACIGLGALIILPFYSGSLGRVIHLLPLSADIKNRLDGQMNRFLFGIRAFHDYRRLALFLVFTAAIWLVDSITISLGALVVSRQLGLAQAMILLSALGLSSAIPSTPGSVGIYQFVAVKVLVPFGFSTADALAYILIIQISGYLLITFWGLLGIWRLKTTKQYEAVSTWK